MNSVPSLLVRLQTGKFQFWHSKVCVNSLKTNAYSCDGFSDDGQWDADIFTAHAIGCNAVSWAPAILPGSLITSQQAPATATSPNQPLTSASQTQTFSVKRFASAGCDNLVKIWGYREETQSWVEEETLEGHADWVRDIAWAPSIGLPRSYIATASQDKTVIIWTKDTPTSPWVKTPLDPSTAAIPTTGPPPTGRFPDVVWRVSWSLAGNLLAVSCGDGKVTLWKENLKGVWECVSDMNSWGEMLLFAKIINCPCLLGFRIS